MLRAEREAEYQKLDYILKGFHRVLNYSKFSAKVTGVSRLPSAWD